jgi:putative DNA primase/helicase
MIHDDSSSDSKLTFARAFAQLKQKRKKGQSKKGYQKTIPSSISDGPENQQLDRSRLAWLAKQLNADGQVDGKLCSSLPIAYARVLRELEGASSLPFRERLQAILLKLLPADASSIMSLFDAFSPHGADPGEAKTMSDVIDTVGGVTWLWDKWLPRGCVSLVGADPGVGKSAFVLGAIAKAVTEGSQFIDGSFPQETGPVVWCDTESAHAGNVDRITNWGINPNSFLLPGDNPLDGFKINSPQDLQRVRNRVVYYGAPLVVIDSLRNAHDSDENCSEMAGVMQILSTLAQELRISIIVIHHLKKREFGSPLDQHALRGSSAIQAAVRSLIFLSRSNRDPQVVNVKSEKSNFSLAPSPLAFQITKHGITARAPEKQGSLSAVEEAMAFLRDILQDGAVESNEVTERALQRGISKASLVRARKELGVRPGRDGKWYCYIPEDEQEALSQEDENLENLDSLTVELSENGTNVISEAT